MSQAVQNEEGIYSKDQNKDINYSDRVNEQEELKQFTSQVFGSKKEMSLQEYKEFNTRVSSEMYFSLIQVLHEQLPCSQNFFRLKKLYRQKLANAGRKS